MCISPGAASGSTPPSTSAPVSGSPMAMLATGPGPKAARAPTAADAPPTGNRTAPTTEKEMAATPTPQPGAGADMPDAEAAKSYVAQMVNSKNAHDQRVGKFLGTLLDNVEAENKVATAQNALMQQATATPAAKMAMH